MSVMDDYEDKRELAVSLLMQVGALSTCPVHDEIIDGGKDVEGAYKLAMSKWARGKHPEFENAREFTDYIKEIYEEYEDGECGACANVRDA
jgi:hypothetical protein